MSVYGSGRLKSGRGKDGPKSQAMIDIYDHHRKKKKAKKSLFPHK